MLDATKRETELSSQSIIAQGTKITGNVFCKNSSIKVEGEIEGKIEADGTVIVFDTGVVRGDIKAKQIVISGEVTGNTIVATERLEITAKGRVKGNITAPRISIAEGVFFEGTCSMQLPGASQPQSQPQPQSQQKSTPPSTPTSSTSQPQTKS